MYLQHISDQEATANDAVLGELFTGENPLLIFLLIAVAAPIMEEMARLYGYLVKECGRNQHFMRPLVRHWQAQPW